jgi:purine-binding chemotaxis protein CheW
VFSLAGDRYAIAFDCVREVQPLRDVTPVPCTPGFVVGVVNIRGAIYSVIDIRGFFGGEPQAITESSAVILVAAAGLEVGILADVVQGATWASLADVRPLAAPIGVRAEYVRGVSRDMLTLIDVEALLRDERIIVRDEAG